MKLTQKDKYKITSDWQKEYPSYQKYKNLQLLKRYGPLLFGIYLKPVYGEEHYVPVFFIHSLLSNKDTISLNAQHALLNQKNVEDSISLTRHNKELNQLSKRIAQQVFLLTDEPVTFYSIQKFYKEFIQAEVGYPIYAIIDYLLFLAWANKKDIFEQEFIFYDSLIKNFPNECRILFRSTFEKTDNNNERKMTNNNVKLIKIDNLKNNLIIIE